MPKKFYKLNEALDALGIGRTALYEEMAAGRLKYIQYGRRRLIPAEALDAFAAELSADQHPPVAS